MFEYNDIRIRPVEESDLPNMVNLRADPSIWTNLGSIHMINLYEQKKWFERVSSDLKVRYYILCSKDINFIGIVRTDEIDSINRSIRIGGDILPRYHGKGYGTKMYKLLLKYCFDFLNMNRVWLLVLETNEMAIKLYQKAGFTIEGAQRQAIYRYGEYTNYIMMSILKSEYRKQNISKK